MKRLHDFQHAMDKHCRISYEEADATCGAADVKGQPLAAPATTEGGDGGIRQEEEEVVLVPEYLRGRVERGEMIPRVEIHYKKEEEAKRDQEEEEGVVVATTSLEVKEAVVLGEVLERVVCRMPGPMFQELMDYMGVTTKVDSTEMMGVSFDW